MATRTASPQRRRLGPHNRLSLRARPAPPRSLPPRSLAPALAIATALAGVHATALAGLARFREFSGVVGFDVALQDTGASRVEGGTFPGAFPFGPSVVGTPTLAASFSLDEPSAVRAGVAAFSIATAQRENDITSITLRSVAEVNASTAELGRPASGDASAFVRAATGFSLVFELTHDSLFDLHADAATTLGDRTRAGGLTSILLERLDRPSVVLDLFGSGDETLTGVLDAGIYRAVWSAETIISLGAGIAVPIQDRASLTLDLQLRRVPTPGAGLALMLAGLIAARRRR